MANCIMRIYCGNCRRKWDVYWRDVKADSSNICPFCGAEIDRSLWERDIIPAAGAALDSNMELERDAEGYLKPGFNVNYLYRKDA